MNSSNWSRAWKKTNWASTSRSSPSSVASPCTGTARVRSNRPSCASGSCSIRASPNPPNPSSPARPEAASIACGNVRNIPHGPAAAPVQETAIKPPAPAIELTPNLRALAAHVDVALARALPARDQAPVELHRAMHYAVMGSGKRMRPMLVYATGAAFGAPPERLDAAAVAVEIIHAYSLVHDDLPAMDDDDLRRGRPTCHIAFGEAMAILAGDALQALAFDVLANDAAADIDPETRLEMLRVLAQAC